MSKRSTKKSTGAENTTLSRAHVIAQKIGDQVQQLVERNWRDISEIIEGDESGTIKVGFSTVINDRAPEPGTHADKDSRIKTTLSFAVKTSDSVESDIPDPAQTSLPLGAPDEDAPIVE